MKTNEDKCHLIVSTTEATEIQIGDYAIKNSNNEKLLGVYIDNKLNFDYHVDQLCKESKQKIKGTC